MSDLTTEVIGFRQWRVTPDLGLRAAAHRKRAVWAAGANEATCHKVRFDDFTGEELPTPRCAEAPGHDCECGWYALHGPGDLWYGKKGTMHGLWGSMYPEPTDPLVSGVIAAWGNLEVHHQGFRAQFARIVALAEPESRREAAVVRAVTGEYGVPVVPIEELPLIAAEFGAVVPVELRPEKPEPKPDNPGVYFSSFHQAMKQAWSVSTGTTAVVPPAVVPIQKSRKERKYERMVERAINKRRYDPRAYLPKHRGGLA